MKNLIVTLSVISALISSAAQAQQQPIVQMSLEDCLDYAMGNNYSRQSMALNEEAAQDVYEQSRMERLPGVSASLSENYNHVENTGSNWNGSYSLSTSMTLYQGGNINSTIDQSKLRSEQAPYRTSQYDNQLTVQILQSFLSVLGTEELLKYQQTVAVASEEQMKQGQQLVKVGSILESDYLLLESQYVTDTTNIAQSIIDRDNGLLNLKSLMSMDPLTPLEIVYPDSAIISELVQIPAEDYVLERAMTTLPDLIISGYDVAIAEKGVNIARSAYAPSLSLGGSIGSGHQQNFAGYGNQLSDRFNQQVGLTLSIPIFNKGRTKSNVTQSRITLRQAELDNKQTELDTRQTVVEEYLNVLAASSKYEASAVKQNAYGKSFDAYRAQFNAGSITTVELLQQQNNYINALNDYIQNKYNFIFRRKVLDVYMGERITM